MSLSVIAVGAVAGLAVATPFGPISLLLLETGRRLGVRRGFSAALGVALTDLFFALVAASAGVQARALIGGHERAVSIGSGVVLLAVAGWTVVRGLGRYPSNDVAPHAPAPAPPPPSPSSGRLLLSFLGLTLVNPLTIVAFVAVTSGVRVEAAPAAVVLFALVVFAVSLAWQTGLVGGGAVLARVLSPAVQWLTSVVGGLAIAGLAVRALVG
jgi:threonine/homoserine/homoserine lactone efflux protein